MTLAVLQFTVQDASGNIVPGAHVEVRLEVPGQPLAALFSDRAGTGAIGNPFDANSEGFAQCFIVGGAYQVRVYTGASGAPTTEHFNRYVAIGMNAEADSVSQRTQRVVTAAGAVTVAFDDADDVIVQKTVGATTAVSLPDPVLRTKPVRIIDGKGDANTNNITISVPSGKKLFGVLNGTAIIDGNGGMMEFTPRADGTGWS